MNNKIILLFYVKSFHNTNWNNLQAHHVQSRTGFLMALGLAKPGKRSSLEHPSWTAMIKHTQVSTHLLLNQMVTWQLFNNNYIPFSWHTIWNSMKLKQETCYSALVPCFLFDSTFISSSSVSTSLRARLRVQPHTNGRMCGGKVWACEAFNLRLPASSCSHCHTLWRNGSSVRAMLYGLPKVSKLFWSRTYSEPTWQRNSHLRKWHSFRDWRKLHKNKEPQGWPSGHKLYEGAVSNPRISIPAQCSPKQQPAGNNWREVQKPGHIRSVHLDWHQLEVGRKQRTFRSSLFLSLLC